MNLESFKKTLSIREGRENKKYLCTKKHWTIGVGWNMDANPLPKDIKEFEKLNGYITDEMIDRLLNISIEAATNNCRDIYKEFDSFSENRRFALIDLMFNMGSGKILKGFPSFVKAVNVQDWQLAADELKYSNGKIKNKLSDYWKQLHGDPDGADDGKLERPEEIYKALVNG